MLNFGFSYRLKLLLIFKNIRKDDVLENLLNQGVGLALFGMVTVFSFLTLLILATRLMSFIVSRIDSEHGTSFVNKEQLPDNRPPIAVITAAIAHYLSRKHS